MADDTLTVEQAKAQLLSAIHDLEAMPTDDSAGRAGADIDALIAAVRAETTGPYVMLCEVCHRTNMAVLPTDIVCRHCGSTPTRMFREIAPS